jgi:hypothetical protein
MNEAPLQGESEASMGMGTGWSSRLHHYTPAVAFSLRHNRGLGAAPKMSPRSRGRAGAKGTWGCRPEPKYLRHWYESSRNIGATQGASADYPQLIGNDASRARGASGSTYRSGDCRMDD